MKHPAVATKLLGFLLPLTFGCLSFAQETSPTNDGLSQSSNAQTNTTPSSASSPSSASAEAVKNLSFGGALEIQAQLPFQNGAPDSDRGRVRSFELTGQTRFNTDTQVPVGAKVTVGGFDNAGDLEIDLREAFAQASFQRAKLDFRVGKYFLPIGLFNQTRHSAWVTPSAPRVISRFFGEDGIVDTGVDLSYHPFEVFRIRAGVMNGYTFDAGAGTAGLKPLTPTHYVRPTFEFGLGSRDMTVSGNYVGRMDDTGTVTRIAGLDFTLVPTLSEARSWFLQGELFHRYVQPSAVPTSKELGATVYFEKGLTESVGCGLRADAFTVTSLKTNDGADRSNLDWALAPNVTFFRGNEIKLQAAYTYLKETRSGDSDRTEQVLELRLVTELGAISKVRGLPGDRSSL